VADTTCDQQLDCAIEAGRVTDSCGGGVSSAMLACLQSCSTQCLSSAGARLSQVTRLDYDRSESPDRALTLVNGNAPIRIVGAGTSPCVPVVPF